MEATAVTAFCGVSLVFALTPGADWAYVITTGGRDRRGVAPAVAGLLTGHLLAIASVVVGVATVITSSPLAMTLLTLAGSCYLVWLGIAALRRPAEPPRTPQPPSFGPGRGFATGVGVSLLNPKVFLLLLALLPLFASPTAPWSLGQQMATLGLIHLANCAVVYVAVGVGAAAALTTRPRAARAVAVASGVVMIGLGLTLIVEQMVAHVG